ncbi:FxsA family protein [uncultured Ruegeria sp.]|uniref:FxsA family protein n=1 Tax=uncultured Ruegeria sp. TaxID=259304 RepID=UPI0026362E03|nr:FxsA family protein [uncultured Ruegeria sp.]
MYLFLAFLLVPIIEIALFIQVGGLIGLWPTLAIVVLTAVLGTLLVRTQGRMALANLQRSFAELDDPTEPLAHGAMILLSGVLLLTPGFFTDAVGFALLVPGIRVAVFRYLKSKATITHFQMGTGAQFRSGPESFSQDDVIDGEFTEVRPRKEPGKPSKWVEGPHQH